MSDEKDGRLENRGESKAHHETHFRGSATGPIHAGSGDIMEVKKLNR